MIIEHYHKFISSNLQTSIQYLLDSGLRIGSGNYGICLVPPDKDYVYKVWTQDEAYEKWIKYCMEHPTKHFPKVYKVVTLPMEIPGSNHHEITVAKIQKYTKPSDSFYKNIKWKTIDGDTINFYKSHLFRPNFREDNISEFRKALQAYNPLNTATKTFTTVILQLIAVLEKISPSIKLDIHEDNIMMDGKTFIITDPAVGFESNDTLALSRNVPNEPKSRLRKLNGDYIVDYDLYFSNNTWSKNTPDAIYIQHLQRSKNKDRFFDELPNAEVILKFLKVNFPRMITHNAIETMDAYTTYTKLGYNKQMANLFIDIMHSDIELSFINKYMLPVFANDNPTMESRFPLFYFIRRQL